MAATITLPAEYLGALMQLCQDRRGALTEHTHLGPGRLLLRRAGRHLEHGLRAYRCGIKCKFRLSASRTRAQGAGAVESQGWEHGAYSPGFKQRPKAARQTCRPAWVPVLVTGHRYDVGSVSACAWPSCCAARVLGAWGCLLQGKTINDCRYALPLAELGGDFYDELKSLSSGYASFDYAEGPTRRAELVRPCAKFFKCCNRQWRHALSLPLHAPIRSIACCTSACNLIMKQICHAAAAM